VEEWDELKRGIWPMMKKEDEWLGTSTNDGDLFTIWGPFFFFLVAFKKSIHSFTLLNAKKRFQ
jgi:hypothetical protein